MKTRWMTLSLAPLTLCALLTIPLAAAAQSAFEVVGFGTVETNCFATLVSSCTVTSTVQVTGTPVLAGELLLTFDTGAPAFLNGYPGGPSNLSNPGVCLPASFLGLLTETAGDSIAFHHAGLACEEGPPGSPYVYHGTFRVTGGTGRFTAAAGGGSVVGTLTRDTAAAFVYLRGAPSY